MKQLGSVEEGIGVSSGEMTLVLTLLVATVMVMVVTFKPVAVMAKMTVTGEWMVVIFAKAFICIVLR